MGARCGAASARRAVGSGLAVPFVLALLLTGCAGSPGGGPAPPSTSVATASPTASVTSTPTADGLLIGSATVLDDGSGPELCLGAVMESYPPQCNGVPLTDWRWPADGVERAGGVTWGSFFVVGRYDGRRFQVERLVDEATAGRSLPAGDDPDFASPCPEPAGGWRAPEPARSTSEHQEEAFAKAERLPGYGGAWLDDRGDPAQDPLTSVVNVRVTGDLGVAEHALREVWGGPLCVSPALRAVAELTRVAKDVARQQDVLSSGVSRDVVYLQVVRDDGSLQRMMDARYGAGVVVVGSALQPFLG